MTKTDSKKELVRNIRRMGVRYSVLNVYSDFIEMAALAINNQVPALYSEEKEARYLKAIGRYREEDRKSFGEMLGILMLAVEAEKSSGRYVDILGPVFHDLELHNKWTGQFFTPVNICDMMAEMTWDDSLHNLIREDGYITVSEPACGSGALVLSFATTMARRGHNPTETLLADVWDIDARCLHMAYVQMSLYGVPAVLRLGNSLKMEPREVWYTPGSLPFLSGSREKSAPMEKAV